MSENIINFADALNYTPYVGDGAAALLPFDGLVRTRIIKHKLGKSNAGNTTVKLVMAVQEDDASGTLYADIPISGTNAAGDKNVNKFFDLMTSGGVSLEELQTAGKNNKQRSVDEILNEMVSANTIIIVDVAASTYQGRTSSKVKNFVSPKRFSDAQTAGTVRRPRAVAASNGATATATPATGGADPLQQLIA